jgi:hypothetical protein
MARKKPMQYVPLEERPEFIAAVAALPADPVELEARASGARQLYHDAMLAGDVPALDEADVVYRACVIKLNGGTHFGSAVVQVALEAKFSAPSGQVPAWGQAGEFLLEVEGIRIVVKMCPDSLSNHCGAELRAVDFDRPFLSRTGYRHQYMRPAQHLGRSVDQAVRAEVLELLAGEGKAVAIDQEHGTPKDRKVYPWLADALAGVRPDGQMAMFGDAPKDPNAKVPQSNAERQRRHRQRLKELADTEGLKAIPLTQTDRMVLSLGLLAHEDLDHRPKDWATTKKPGFDALLTKLWPEGENGRYLAEPQRSTRRPAAFLRDELARQQTMVQRLQEENRALRAGQPVAAEVSVSADDPHNWARTVRLTRDEDSLMLWAFSVYFTARADLEHLESPYVLENLERIFQGCPIWTDEFKANLDQDQGVINRNKHRDKEAKRGWKCYEDERKTTDKLYKERTADRAEIKRLQDAIQQIAQEVAGPSTVAPVAG